MVGEIARRQRSRGPAALLGRAAKRPAQRRWAHRSSVPRAGGLGVGLGVRVGRRPASGGQALPFASSARAINRLTRDTDKPSSFAIAVMLIAPVVCAW